MVDEIWLCFCEAYKTDIVYGKIIQDLVTSLSSGRKLNVIKDNKDVVSALKPGYLFRLVNGLLYNRDNDRKERLVIPFLLI